MYHAILGHALPIQGPGVALRRAVRQFRVVASDRRPADGQVDPPAPAGGTHRYLTLDDPRALRLAQTDPDSFSKRTKVP